MRTTSKFLVELARIANNYDWYFVAKNYKGGNLVIKEIRGVSKGGDITKEYIPLTAVVDELTGRFYEMNRFDMAANEIQMPGDCVNQIIDACDEWPDRLHGYSPKHYEKKFREDVLKICFPK